MNPHCRLGNSNEEEKTGQVKTHRGTAPIVGVAAVLTLALPSPGWGATYGGLYEPRTEVEYCFGSATGVSR